LLLVFGISEFVRRRLGLFRGVLQTTKMAQKFKKMNQFRPKTIFQNAQKAKLQPSLVFSAKL